MVNFMKTLLRQNFVAAISRTNSNQFEFVRLIAATKLAEAAFSHRVYTSGNKSLPQNVNEPMRERHMVSHVELEN